ncbi:Uu.00g102280.m01.CDS01 [Anthostomella pinea]|uniref:Uu.00g102280.m01.CDS01 n=1 Tax=Anthostomella pinea TaxID=933095 RepID=A0AAI8YFM1_9PEZI|nr:Uu.00g102280.m01.CDS01 [Anthostomella pinea]
MRTAGFLSFVLAALPCLRVASAGCRVVSRGITRDLLLRGTVITPEGALPNYTVLVQSGKVTYVGDSCGLGTRARDASHIECADSVISPGFINTHEHIEYSTVRPLADIGELVDHRHDWRVGARGHTPRYAPVNGSKVEATRWGELRHLFSGTTSIVGGAMVSGLTRNLDYVAGLEDGLVAPVALNDVFPLDDADGIMRNGDCDYGPEPMNRETAGKLHRYIAHIGEGLDAEAANEFACLSNMTFDNMPASDGGGLSTDLIAPNLAIIHALGLSTADFDLVAARDAQVVWSPRSNVFLYGKTLNVTYLLEAGITVALGTDWLPSGSATMGREAVCAASFTEESYGMTLEPKTLWEMMTLNAAKVAGFEQDLGSIEVGKLADIVVFDGQAQGRSDMKHQSDAFAQAIFAPAENIELVLRGGKFMLASNGLKSLSTDTCETLAFGNVNKTACVADELGSSFKEFEASLQGVYPAILPAVPPDEPSCELTRCYPTTQNQCSIEDHFTINTQQVLHR